MDGAFAYVDNALSHMDGGVVHMAGSLARLVGAFAWRLGAIGRRHSASIRCIGAPGGSVRGEQAKQTGLVLSCIEAKFCKKICV